MAIANAQLVGYLGQDPELRYLDTGTAICTFTMAVNVNEKVDGRWQNVPNWYQIVATGRLAETFDQYVSKGEKLAVAGNLSINKYHDKEGNEKTNVRLYVRDFEFFNPKDIQEAEDDGDVPF